MAIVQIIPIAASAGITGFESPAADYHELPLSLDALLIEHPSATFIGRAQGRSMEGVGIFDGDILIVDRHIQVQQHDVVVATFRGEFVCKIIDLKNRALLSAAPGFAPWGVSAEDQFCIEGVVIRSVRCHRPSYLLQEV